ncbi:hypothetical protein [Salinifilum aidingensis]
MLVSQELMPSSRTVSPLATSKVSPPVTSTTVAVRDAPPPG